MEFIQLLTELNMLESLRWDLSTNRTDLGHATDVQVCAIATALQAMLMGGKQMQPDSPVPAQP